MTPALHDTIAALASAPGPAVRGIVRVSGLNTAERVGALFIPDDDAAWRNARTARRHSGNLRLSRDSVFIPAAVAFWPGNRSYTGEPVAEIQTVGSPPLLEQILAGLFALGVRPAQPGEFTLRAFLAGKIDLTQAEAVLGVIDATGRRELDDSLRQLAGGVSQLLSPIRFDLLDLLADLEAGLDFVDEDIEFVSQAELVRRLHAAREALERLLAQSDNRMHSSSGRRVVLAGLPNAGKSTLFNALARRDAAIVSPHPGTTRDWLSAGLVADGIEIELIDTAGWEDSAEAIGREAQRSRSEQWNRADLVLWCVAADADRHARDVDHAARSGLHAARCPVLTVVTKSDRIREENVSQGGVPNPEAIPVCAIDGSGLDSLQREITRQLSSTGAPARELIGSTAARCRESLATAVNALRRAMQESQAQLGDELVALSIREALDSMGAILGVVYTDDILDRIFSRFCIGK